MKSQIIEMVEHEVSSPVNDITSCFYIVAQPIVEEGEDDIEDLDTFLANGGDITDLANKSNISPFRTLLFPNSERIMNAFIKVIEDNEDRIDRKEKPIYPTINLNRFEVEAPEPYFRRFVKDTEENKAGQWIKAQQGDETDPNDPLQRKIFRTITVTSLCKTDENGNDTPTENITRKALRAWTVGLETEAGNGKMLTPVAARLRAEAVRAKAKESEDTSADEILANKAPRRERRRTTVEDDF